MMPSDLPRSRLRPSNIGPRGVFAYQQTATGDRMLKRAQLFSLRFTNDLQHYLLNIGSNLVNAGRGIELRQDGRQHRADKCSTRLGIDSNGTRQHKRYVDIFLQCFTRVARIADLDDLQRVSGKALFRERGGKVVSV